MTGALLVMACSDDPPATGCPRKQPEFRLQVTLPDDQPLPKNTTISVRYQGSQRESFSVAHPDNENVDVCCRVARPAVGNLPRVPCNQNVTADAGAPSAVHCELWTGDLPEVTVSAAGYLLLEESLKGQRRSDNCGFETLDVRLVLEQPDGGAQ